MIFYILQIDDHLASCEGQAKGCPFGCKESVSVVKSSV